MLLHGFTFICGINKLEYNLVNQFHGSVSPTVSNEMFSYLFDEELELICLSERWCLVMLHWQKKTKRRKKMRKMRTGTMETGRWWNFFPGKDCWRGCCSGDSCFGILSTVSGRSCQQNMSLHMNKRF